MPSIRVIRPFNFSYPLGRGEKLARERFFPVGEHEIDDVMASHPYIYRHFADGCIETPEQAQQRAEEATVTAKKAQDDADYWKTHAQQAFKRAEALSLVQTNGDPGALERELNTPVNQLGGQQGSGITSTAPGGAGAGSSTGEPDGGAAAGSGDAGQQSSSVDSGTAGAPTAPSGDQGAAGSGDGAAKAAADTEATKQAESGKKNKK